MYKRQLQIFIGSSDDADIEIPVCLVSDRAIPPLLYGTEQHLWGFQREVSYLCLLYTSYLCITFEKNGDGQELLYRLHDFGITVPPLRDCQEDIMPLAEFFRDTLL